MSHPTIGEQLAVCVGNKRQLQQRCVQLLTELTQLRAQLEAVTKERDEARKELIELSQVHQLVIKSRDRLAIDLTSAKIRAAEFKEQRDRLLDDMQNILEYWNCAPEAAVDAIEHARDVAATALEEIAKEKEGRE